MKPVLGYFKLRGWAGPIRLLLAYLEVDYEERLYELPTTVREKNSTSSQCASSSAVLADWCQEKFSLGLPFPNLPYWIEGQIKLSETKAILKHISRTRAPTLLGSSVEDKAKLNVLEEVLWDMWNSLCQVCLRHDDDTLGKFLTDAKYKLNLLSDNFTGLWAIGSNVTYVDFLLYEVLYHYKLFYEMLSQPFPTLQSFLSRFESIPSIQKYMHSQRFINGPCFSNKFKSKL
ncbi:Glutathione S-transferase Mu 1 [Orchesella cincta]|uniref:glutathione transferase n=1 Tax=Orchesella cincta TaxID=48709 RepID=A0A1D2N9Y7_ORCCI|nr:Glutathione S-transferase Mu 1 [Orchesella cincta]